MNTILSFFEEHPELIKMLFGGTSAVALLGKLISLAKKKPPKRVNPFDIIKPRSDVERLLLGGDDDDPFAARNIPYQDRIQGRDIRKELEHLFHAKKKWVLILGRKGIGKTREAVHFIHSLSEEGWTVLNLTRPATTPEVLSESELGTSRKILFFIDDLNRRISVNPRELSPEENDSQPVRSVSLQENLLQLIQAFERIYGSDEIRVIATARDERMPEFEGQASPWERLQFEAYPEFWERFEIYPLPNPDDTAIVNVLKKTASQAKVTVNPRDYTRFAQRNDQTFDNIVENLRRAKSRGAKLLLKDFQDTLSGTWQERYTYNVGKYPAAVFVYDAVELLQAIQVDPDARSVRQLAVLISASNPLRRRVNSWRIRQALDYLRDVEHILQPRDGQIEAKGYSIDIQAHMPALARVLQAHFQRSNIPSVTLSQFAQLAISLGRCGEAEKIYAQYLRLNPTDGEAWYWLGRAQTGMAETKGAMESFNKALQYSPKLYWAYLDLADAEVRNGLFMEALASTDKALQIQRHDHQIWIRRGQIQLLLEQFQEALASFEKALQYRDKNEEAMEGRNKALAGLGHSPDSLEGGAVRDPEPEDADGWMSRGNAERLAGRPREALLAYRKSIAARPDYAEAWYGQGLAFADLKQHKKAIKCYEKALALKSDLHWALYDWGIAEQALNNFQTAVEKYKAAIRCRRDYADAWFRLGLTQASLGNTDAALSSLSQALRADPKMYWIHFDRGEILRQAGRHKEAITAYDEAIRHHPEGRSWRGRGLAFYQLKRYQDAISSLTQALALKESADKESADIWLELGRAESADGGMEKALSSFDKALKIKRSFPEALYEKARCLCSLSKPELAMKSLKALARLDSGLLLRAKDDPFFGELENQIEKILCEHYPDSREIGGAGQ